MYCLYKYDNTIHIIVRALLSSCSISCAAIKIIRGLTASISNPSLEIYNLFSCIWVTHSEFPLLVNPGIADVDGTVKVVSVSFNQ